MCNDKENKLYDFVISNEIATEEEVSLVTYINGNNVESYWSIIYVRTGLRNMEQLKSEGYYNTDNELDE